MRALMAVVLLVLTACGGGTPAAGPSDPSAGATGAGAGIGQAAPGGALTVEEALGSDLDLPLLVQGTYLHAEGSPPRLCGAILESFPPQCGEPSLVVEGVKEAELDGVTREGGVTWAEQVRLLGRVENGTITVDPAIQG